MADAVSTTTLVNYPNRLVVKITNLSDGTGESAVVKVDKSTFTNKAGVEPTSLTIESIKGDVVGMEVYLYADHTTDVPIARLGGLGKVDMDFRSVGGIQTAGAGDTGDITLTTNGHAAGDSYDLTISMLKSD
jgi:hypothetical protein